MKEIRLFQETDLKALFQSFQDLKILVIGDFYLDSYWYIDKTRSTLSLETPWYTNPVVEQRYSPGAAGTVTNNLITLGVGTVYALSVIGQDGFGETLLSSLNERGCQTELIIKASNWVTPTYVKPMHRGYEGVEDEGPRFDIENQTPMNESVERSILDRINNCVSQVDGIIIADQVPSDGLGVITERVREALCHQALSHHNKVFLVDSRKRIGKYRNVIIKPNRFEAQRALVPDWQGIQVDFESGKQCAVSLSKKTKSTVYVTLGPEGIIVYHNDRCSHIQGIQIDDKIDPVGAGDSVTAGIVSTLCSLGMNAAIEAAYIGNLVASITVTKLGTTGTATPEEVIERHRGIN